MADCFSPTGCGSFGTTRCDYCVLASFIQGVADTTTPRCSTCSALLYCANEYPGCPGGQFCGVDACRGAPGSLGIFESSPSCFDGATNPDCGCPSRPALACYCSSGGSIFYSTATDSSAADLLESCNNRHSTEDDQIRRFKFLEAGEWNPSVGASTSCIEANNLGACCPENGAPCRENITACACAHAYNGTHFPGKTCSQAGCNQSCCGCDWCCSLSQSQCTAAGGLRWSAASCTSTPNPCPALTPPCLRAEFVATTQNSPGGRRLPLRTRAKAEFVDSSAADSCSYRSAKMGTKAVFAGFAPMAVPHTCGQFNRNSTASKRTYVGRAAKLPSGNLFEFEIGYHKRCPPKPC